MPCISKYFPIEPYPELNYVLTLPSELLYIAAWIIEFLTTYKWWLIGAAVASALGFISMGGPGVLLIALFDQIYALTKTSTPGLRGEMFWPMAIVYALFTPWIAFLIYLGLRHLPLGLEGWSMAAVVLILTFLTVMAYDRLCGQQTPTVMVAAPQENQANDYARLDIPRALKDLEPDDRFRPFAVDHAQYLHYADVYKKASSEYHARPDAYHFSDTQKAYIKKVDDKLNAMGAHDGKKDFGTPEQWIELETLAREARRSFGYIKPAMVAG